MARTSSAELHSRILDAANEVLAEEGAAAVTQRAVAARAGVSPQSIYNRFDSKNSLLDEVVNQGFIDLTERLRNQGGIALEEIADPIENIVEGMRRYRAFAIENASLYGLMFDAQLAGFSISDRTLGTAFTSLEVLIDAVQRACDAGVLTQDGKHGDVPLAMAQRIWAAGHGVLRFELTNVGFVDDWTAHHDATIRTMLNGLAT